MFELKSFFEYLLVVVLTLFCFVLVTHLWNADFSIPINYAGYAGYGSYQGDALLAGSLIKGVIDNGWYLNNPYLSAPGAFNFADYPMAENANFLLIKLLSYFSSNYAI